MIIEIINVGTELLLGEIVNTNATYIQKMCKELGFDVFHQSVVGDNPQRFMECLKVAFERGANCVITTGGLGPTTDDLTKVLSAQFLGLEMEYLDEEANKVEDKCKFVTNSRIIPANNLKQANFPVGAIILENSIGTANGCIMKKDERRIINLPGPPKEMRYVIEHSLLPILVKERKDTIYSYEIVTSGIGESKIDELLASLINDQEEVSIALYAQEDFVRVRLAVKTKHQEIANDKMKPIISQIEQVLQEYIIDTDNLKEALYQIMPPYEIRYHDDFRLPATFCLGKTQSEEGTFKIDIRVEDHKLGQRVHVILGNGDKYQTFVVCLLVDATLSMEKLLAKITHRVYLFLTK